jgi:hypothetical protein
MTTTGEKKRIRDYPNEYQRRTERQKRLLVDMDREKAEIFIKHLRAKNITFAAWINNAIDNELNN